MTGKTRIDEARLLEHVERIVRCGALGRSPFYVNLLRLLAACTIDGRVPKEQEIAIEAFHRPADFDPSDDALVRVYAHYLRQKLKRYYLSEGRQESHQIVLPRGEYRLTFERAKRAPGDIADEPEVTPVPETWTRRFRSAGGRARLFLGSALLIAIGLAAGAGFSPIVIPEQSPAPMQVAARAPIWRAVLDDEVPILVVVGDYYVVGELDASGNVGRMVRDFSVNARGDVDRYAVEHPELGIRYVDLDLTYLPLGTASALYDLLRVVYTSTKAVKVAPMSRLSSTDLLSNHILYVGHVSGLDKLRGLVFASSGLSIGEASDQLVDRSSGKLYASGADASLRTRNYRDYGLLSTFTGPGGTQFVIVAGTGDAGLMETARAASDPSHLEHLEAVLSEEATASAPSFEVLYEVAGFDRTNLDDVIVYARRLARPSTSGERPPRGSAKADSAAQ